MWRKNCTFHTQSRMVQLKDIGIDQTRKGVPLDVWINRIRNKVPSYYLQGSYTLHHIFKTFQNKDNVYNCTDNYVYHLLRGSNNYLYIINHLHKNTANFCFYLIFLTLHSQGRVEGGNFFLIQRSIPKIFLKAFLNSGLKIV